MFDKLTAKLRKSVTKDLGTAVAEKKNVLIPLAMLACTALVMLIPASDKPTEIVYNYFYIEGDYIA